MVRYRGLLLDFYGTLVHEDDEIISVICDQIGRSASSEVSSDDIASFWWESFSSLFQQSHDKSFLSQRDAAVMSLGATIEHFGASLNPAVIIGPQVAHWGSPAIFPDTRPFLDFAMERGLSICVVSNIDRIDLEQAIKFHGLHFDHIVTSDDVRSYKPRPEMFRAALEKLGLAPSEVLHVGDSRTSDVTGALQMEIPVAWVNRSGKQVTGEMRPDYTVRDLGELKSILEAGFPTQAKHSWFS